MPICLGKDLFDRLLQPGKVIIDEDPHPLDPAPLKVLENLFPIPGAFPSCAEEQNPMISLRPSGLIPRPM